jgi:cholesterol oxidase
MRSVAQEMRVGDTFTLAPVGVFFGEPGRRVPDPFFGGAGPERSGCLQCGECMTGCRHGAKNTLVKNYLALAERAGAQVVPMTTVTGLVEQDGGWQVSTGHTGGWSRRGGTTYTARYVVLAAGTWGTQRLLHRLADTGALPRLSPRLGELTRTNSESIVGAIRPRVEPGTDLTRGVAITSSFHPSPDTHVEPVRYGRGSNAMGLLQTLMTDGTGRGPRWLRFLGAALRSPADLVRTAIVHRWSERSIIALVMQDLDNSITTSLARGPFGWRRMTSRQGHGIPNPTWIPQANDVARRIARRIGGIAAGSWGDVADVPLTAHFLGGCVIGADAERGVIDPYHRVHGYPNLSIVDGSAVSANLGVNPSLTITAQAERAAALWPNNGETDPRPTPGEAYRPVAPVRPRSPVVPASAPGALRLPRSRAFSRRGRVAAGECGYAD